jgi:hypothetical protein
MEITEKEERLILRYWKPWHTVFRRLKNIFAFIGFALVVILVVMVLQEKSRREAYRQELIRLNEQIAVDSSAAQYIDISQFASLNGLMRTLTEQLITAVKGLKLKESDLRGFYLVHDVRPSDVLGFKKGVSWIDVFTDCGCEQKGVYNIIRIELNPTTLKASVTGVQSSVSLDNYEPPLPPAF